MSKSIPDRWLQYKPYGEVIQGTKILAFKVPLREGVAKNLQPQQRFTTAILLQSFPQLKYIVDLTNTSRYYDKKDFIDAGVKYEKVMVPGIQVPPMDVVKKFFKAMDDFTAVCGENEMIGVHCTHGVNRTGYFICRYLVQQLGWKLTHALQAFQEARGYPIERQNYVSELRKAPCGRKIDTSKVNLTLPSSNNTRARKVPVKRRPPLNHPGGRPPPPPPPYLMGPPGPGFHPPPPPRRGFANGGPFPRGGGPPRGFNFPAPPQPGYGPRLGGPPPPPPPHGARFGPRLGPRMGMRSPMPPMPPMGAPAPHPRGPPRMPLPPRMPMPPRMSGPPRLPMGPLPRLPPAKMPPPRLPLAAQHIAGKRNSLQNSRKRKIRAAAAAATAITKNIKDQDFTVDTFEENLTTAPPGKARRVS
ncbi:RNA/RNP complex-1-interacting phosphatase-like [Leptopilina heterotoma]|uniref:RNA/RNP complex-1-interacting phosphatase-like n=1 Tax=Leptopilina heterotoma TaxID=63436 RepID=UPI001CA97E05|nr:RNA/RNP complex-1-interacting phosphatase-like [Leptopilina heterotoma]